MEKLGLDITEKEYRTLPHPSYSLLSSIAKYGRDAIFGEKEDISDLDGIIIGSLVDSALTDGGFPDDLIVIDKKPTGKPLSIIKSLSRRQDLVTSDILSIKNISLIEEELNNVAYYQSSGIKDRLRKLKNYNKYAKALQDPNALVVSEFQLYQAKALTNSILLKYPDLFDEDTEMQVKLLGTVGDCTVKIMLDFIVIDHEKKVIRPYDLKTGIGPHHEFFNSGFLGYNYYIQASLYKHVLKQYVQIEYPEYTVDNFRFLYCGRKDKLSIIFKVSDKFDQAGWDGFEYLGKKYPGIIELLEDFEYYTGHPNTLYKNGYNKDEVEFDDSFL